MIIASPSHTYSPGLLEQDLYTIPVEAGLIGAMNAFYTKSSHPLFPFDNETNNRNREASRHSTKMLASVGTAVVAGTLTSASFSPAFHLGVHLRGWIHAHLVTEVFTTFSKVTFLRHRPFYDTEAAKGPSSVRLDDHFSFFSGHSSHAFAFATYSSAILREYVPEKWCGWISTAALYSGASAVAVARVTGGQHHWSDVIAGSFVGALTSYGIYHRVEEVIAEEEASAEGSGGASLYPEVNTADETHPAVALTFKYTY